MRQALFSFVKSFVSSQLAEGLNKFRELNGDEKADKLKSSLKDGFELLKEVTDKTKTKVDDTAIAMFLDAIAQAE